VIQQLPVNGLNGYSGQPSSFVRRFVVALVALLFVITIGTTGFMTLERMELLDACYMTIITLSTVGFGEVKPLHPSGKMLAIFVILTGVAVGTYTATTLGQLVVEGQFKEMFGRKKMKSKIGQLTNHYVIAGFGRVGQQVALEFQRGGVDFVVIERDPEQIKSLMNLGYLFLEGEATTDEVLREVRIEHAHTLISTLPDEAQNVYLALSARDMNKNLNIIARADYEGGEKKLQLAGANHVVSPHVIGGQRMAMASLRPNVVDFMHMTSLGEGGLSIEEIVIPVGSSLAGQSLMESKLKETYGVTIIGLRRGASKMIIAPGPKETLGETDTLILIGPSEGLQRLGERFSAP